MVKILCLIDTDDRNYYFRRALKKLEEEFPGEIGGECFSPRSVRMDKNAQDELMEKARDCDFAVVYFHGSCQSLPDFHRFWEGVTGHAPCFYNSALPEEMGELMPSSGLSPEQYRQLDNYFSRASENNAYRMLLAIAHTFFGKGRPAEGYEEIPHTGLFVQGRILSKKEADAYLKEAMETALPVIGIIIHRSYIQSGNTRGLKALIRAVAGKNAFPLPIFSATSSDSVNPESGIRYALGKYLAPRGKSIADCLLVTTGFSMTHMGYPEGAEGAFRSSMFEQWNVPVIQTMTTRFGAKEYEENSQGIDPLSLPSSVFHTEIDGQIISVPYALSEEQDLEGIGRRIWEPIPDRIEKIAGLAVKYAGLSHKENREKKVAVLFHNLPGNHNIGRGTGLDTFETVHRLLLRMESEGYQMRTPYGDGQELADTLLKALTNDTEWTSPEEALRRSVDLVDPKRQEWYGRLCVKNRDALRDFWGDFPGEVMTEGGKLLIPGILNGNIFIGLQPSRAFGEQADRLYHDAVFPPPYSYIGYYRWIEEIFQADAVIHVGTHGSVEWLPGKEVGLSGACYPDICMGKLPNFYIYHIGITGEGIQAKRRSAATILDHLPPSMDDSGVYDKLADIDAAIKEYYAARLANPAQVGILQNRIRELAEEAELLKDLRLSQKEFEHSPKEAIEKLHLWMEELKNSAVTDGLHIFGEPPRAGRLYENMLRMLVRIRNGSIPALNDAVLTAMGYDAEVIKDSPGESVEGRPASVVCEEAVENAKRIVHALAETGYRKEAVSEVLDAQELPGDRMPLKEVLTFICTVVCPYLDATTDEMENIIKGLNGGFVEPGLGGNPTRGNVSLLPTGRNFYAGDPSEIPSVGAWEIGQKLAKRSLEHYLEERGEYPESIAMVVWAGNVLKTSGEDFGEIFALMGVRPVYLGNTSKVIGVEAVPVEELGHPRIDVTLRISGLFRDMYPNLVELMDSAVSCVAALDESEEENYIKKHINEDMLKLLEEGLDENTALDQAYLRIFGCPAGGYGAGVANLISNRNWTDYNDLAAVYETWSGNGYGRGYHGEKMQGMFKRRLSTVGMTIKNESTIEIDMLSSDDFFSYHGGLVACVRSNSGKTPISLTGHSDDPDKPLVRDTAKETARIMRSRILNPKWLEGLKRHGFKGAQEISKAVDSFFGWDASAEVAQDWMYESIAEDFLFDRETREWMEQVNAGVVYNVAGKLLEADKRGMWNAKEQTREALQKIFLKTEGLLEDGK